jgi:ABC-type iron transport system FetAB permease component
MVYLSYYDLLFSSFFLLAAGILSFCLKLKTEKALLIAASRMVVQLFLVTGKS